MTLAGIIQRYRRWRLKRLGLPLHRSCIVDRSVSVGPGGPVDGVLEIAAECELGLGIQLHPRGGCIRIGRRVFIGPYAVMYGQGGIDIGDHTLVSMHCCILSSEHATPSRDRIIRNQPDILMPTRIGQDVWLGAGVKVLGGVTIGDGCVVGAGAVVTKDLPPYSVAVGVPAAIVRMRA